MNENLKKRIMGINPFVKLRLKKMRSGIENTTMTFLCPNCTGGILFHDLGLKFQSPTVNLMMLQSDFIKFAADMDYYLNKELEFFSHPEYSCPCAYLGDIVIHFTHYKTEEEAAEKWYERAKRINKNNLFIFAVERDGITKDDILKLGSIKARGIVVFTAHKYDDIPYALHIHKYEKDGEIGNIMAKSYFNGSREYEKLFDFVKWFNEADGKTMISHHISAERL